MFTCPGTPGPNGPRDLTFKSESRVIERARRYAQQEGPTSGHRTLRTSRDRSTTKKYRFPKRTDHYIKGRASSPQLSRCHVQSESRQRSSSARSIFPSIPLRPPEANERPRRDAAASRSPGPNLCSHWRAISASDL